MANLWLFWGIVFVGIVVLCVIEVLQEDVEAETRARLRARMDEMASTAKGE